MVKITVAHIPDGQLEMELEQTAQDLDFDIEGVRFSTPLQIRCLVSKTGSEIYIKAQVKGRTELTCTRCLEKFDRGLEEKFNHYYKWQGEPELDITDKVRETVILSFSMKLICNPECKGLCPMCGQNLNLAQCDCRPPAMGSLGEKIKI